MAPACAAQSRLLLLGEHWQPGDSQRVVIHHRFEDARVLIEQPQHALALEQHRVVLDLQARAFVAFDNADQHVEINPATHRRPRNDAQFTRSLRLHEGLLIDEIDLQELRGRARLIDLELLCEA